MNENTIISVISAVAAVAGALWCWWQGRAIKRQMKTNEKTYYVSHEQSRLFLLSIQIQTLGMENNTLSDMISKAQERHRHSPSEVGCLISDMVEVMFEHPGRFIFLRDEAFERLEEGLSICDEKKGKEYIEAFKNLEPLALKCYHAVCERLKQNQMKIDQCRNEILDSKPMPK